MTSPTLAEAFDVFEVSAFRLETHPAYAVPEEAARLAAYRAGQPLPEWSVRTDPWLARMAATTAAGKAWQRLRLMSAVPTLYECYELDGYGASQACGEQIRLALRDEHPELAGRDWWLFDAGTPNAACWLMQYTEQGEFLSVEMADSDTLRKCEQTAQVWHQAVPLNTYVADLARVQHRAVSTPRRTPQVDVALDENPGRG